MVGNDQGAQREHAGERTGGVGGVDVIHALEILVELAQAIDGIGDGRCCRQGHELGRHDTTGGVLLVAQQVADGALLLDAHEAQELLGLLVIELVDEGGGVVGVHQGQHRGRVAIGQALEHLGHELVVIELGDGLGGLRRVELGEDLAAQARVELLDDVGDVRRMQLAEGLVGNGQLDGLRGALEQIHVRPRDDVLLKRLAHRARGGDHDALEHRVQRAQKTADAHLGAEQAQLVFARRGQLDVVHAHDLHALRVDDLLVHDVAGEQHLVGLQIGEADVGGGHFEIHAIVIEALDIFTPRDHERGLAGPLERK